MLVPLGRLVRHPVIQGVLALGLLGAVVYSVDRVALWRALRTADLLYVAAAGLLTLPNLALDGWIWARAARPRVVMPWRTWAGATLCGCAAGFVTPAQLGEFPARAWAVPRADRWTLVGAVGVQRVMDLWAALAGGLVGVGGLLAADVLPAPTLWGLVVGATAGTLAGLSWVMLRPGRVVAWLRRWSRTRPAARRLLFLRDLSPLRVGLLLGATLVRYALYAGQFVLLAWAFAPSLPVGLLAAASGFIFFVKVLLPSLALDLGIREGTALFAFAQLGWPAPAAVGAALLLFVLNVAVPAGLGALVLHRRLALSSSPLPA